METLLRDLRFGLRRLRKSPGFTLIAVLSLALGIGANTAIFSLVEAIVLRDPPIHRPEEIVEVYNRSPDFSYNPYSIPDYRDFRLATERIFSASFGSTMTLLPRDLGDRVESVPAEMVTGEYFVTLGLRPFLGRLLGPSDDVTPGGHAVVVLSHDYWQRDFAGDRAVIGRQVRLVGRSYTVVGVTPPEYQGNLRTLAPSMYLPIMMVNQLQPSGYDQLASRDDHGTFVRARLRPGVGMPAVTTTLQNFAKEMKARGHWAANLETRVLPLSELVVNPMLDRFIRLAAVLLTVVVGLVLLIACANLASFLLAQAREREREIAIRLALGASRGGLVRQLLTESIALAMVGGLLAVALANALLAILFQTDLPLPLPVTIDASLNPIVLTFALGVSLLAGMLFGLAPALNATRTDVISTIKNENTGGGPARRITLRNVLVVSQVALSLVLLVVAGLFLRSLQARQLTDPGFGSEPTAILTMGISSDRYTKEAARLFVQRLEERIRQVPGVQAAGVTGNLHLNTLNTQNIGVNVDGFQPPEGQEAFTIDYTRVDAGFFDAAGIPFVRGRNFNDATDREGGTAVAIINQVMAERFWPGQDPIGRTLRTEDGPHTVIGVARNAKVRTLGEEPRAFVYVPISQNHTFFLSLLARTSGSAELTLRQVLAAARELDPDLIVVESKTMDRHLAIMLLPARLGALVIGAFAMLALALALIGVYGVVSYAVARRKREVGIRLSLGASPLEMVRLLMHDGISLVGIGTIVGLALALLTAGVLRSVLFGIEPIDPLTFTAGPLALLLIGGLAAWMPARRITRIDPARVLKAE
jgi:predicted permease